MHTHLEQWAADAAASGEQLWVRCLAQGSHLSHGLFLLELRFKPTTSGYKSNALSVRPRLPRGLIVFKLNSFSPQFFCFLRCDGWYVPSSWIHSFQSECMANVFQNVFRYFAVNKKEAHQPFKLVHNESTLSQQCYPIPSGIIHQYYTITFVLDRSYSGGSNERQFTGNRKTSHQHC